MPFAELPAFMNALRGQQGTAARALEFAILTAARSGEVFDAVWNEFEGDLWTVPAERMKSGRSHAVPLSPRAIAILSEMRGLRQGEQPLTFPGRNGVKPLGAAAFRQVMARLGRDDVTAHGFRSAFRDWCGDRTNFPREVAEAALAHAVGDKAEQAYRRGSALDKRRKLMEAWAAFLNARQPVAQGKVVPIGAAR
jgi:integrase